MKSRLLPYSSGEVFFRDKEELFNIWWIKMFQKHIDFDKFIISGDVLIVDFGYIKHSLGEIKPTSLDDFVIMDKLKEEINSDPNK